MNIFVDDFIVSGSTVEQTLIEIRKQICDQDFKFDYISVGGTLSKETIKFLDEIDATHNLIGYVSKEVTQGDL